MFALLIAGNRAKSFSIRSAAKWCVQTFPRRSEFAVLQKHNLLLTRKQRDALLWASKAVNEYLLALSRRGLLKICGVLAPSNTETMRACREAEPPSGSQSGFARSN